jgi:hypothetical protein
MMKQYSFTLVCGPGNTTDEMSKYNVAFAAALQA